MILEGIYYLKSNRGNDVPNQIVTELNSEYNFYSYGAFIIGINYTDKVISVGKKYNHSRTTSRYRNQFLHEHRFYEIENLKDLKKAITDGKAIINETEYKVVKVA